MFNISELTKEFQHEVTKTNALNGFGSALLDALKTRRDRLNHYSNGVILLNREELHKVENILLEIRHLEFIWKQVSGHWATSTPAFGRAWNSKIDEAFTAVLSKHREVISIVGP